MRVEEQRATLAKIKELLEKFKRDKTLSALEKNILIDDINYYYHGISKWRGEIFKLLSNLK